MSRIVVNTRDTGSKINRNIYGHFSEHLGRCIYGGLFVGEGAPIPNVNGMRSDVVAALRNIRIPVLRWPGGCFADEYHWKDGIGPVSERKRMVNTHWGGVVEDNSFGTHEFLELCRQLECEPYVNGNLGSGTVQEMSEWVEYMTFDGVSPMAELRRQNGQHQPWGVKYFGVGNENWGCGGNMRPEYYADEYRRYQTYVRSYGENQVYKIACGPSVDDYNWTEVLMKNAGRYMDALTMHHYTVPGDWQDKGSALQFSDEEYLTTMEKAFFMEELISKHLAIMDRHDPEHKVGLIVDEWGTWHNVEPGTNPGFLYQQNTMRDAMVAALTLNIFNSHSDRVVMANIAQTVNVLQAVVLTEGDKMVLTPTYHVFDMYKQHQDATLVHSTVQGDKLTGQVPKVSASASVNEAGELCITAVNLSATESEPIDCDILGKTASKVTARILSGQPSAYNDFTHPQDVGIQNFADGRVSGGTLSFTLPACSVVQIVVS